jgi:serine/threonine protein kinase
MSAREPGAVLDGKYQVVRPLATGGMGEVYLVRHLHLEEQRVVKILRPEIAADEAHRKRFLREARLATQIKHPNVAILYDFAQLPDGAFYMVWEHVEGQEIAERLSERGPFPVVVAIELGIQALRGLGAIHALGVVHRDISPDNLMLTRDHAGRPRIKIIDLGLAKTLAPDPNFEVTQAGTFMGKLRYCSPEQAETMSGEELDRRSDLYSFGLVLYEMVTGTSPFGDDDKPAFVFKRLSQDPMPMRGRVAGIEVPADFDKAVLRALERDRDARFSDAIQFIEALDRVGQALSPAATQRLAVVDRQADTQPIPVPRRPPAPASGQAPPRERTGTVEMSPDERRSLLDQIDRAARRVRETTEVLSRVELAIRKGELDAARRLISELEAASPGARGLADLKRQLADAEHESGREARVAEVEKMLGGYIKNNQLQLAELAYESLVDLDPRHPRQGDYLGWIEMMHGDLEQQRQADEALAAGRAAVAEGDERGARRALEALKKADPSGEAAVAFEQEIGAGREQRRQVAELDRLRARFEDHDERGKLDDARRELGELEKLGATRVTLDFLRGKLDQARGRAAAAERTATVEKRFRARLAAGDFQGARDAAVAYDRELPGGDRTAELFAEVARLEEEHRRRDAVAQGERQIEELIRQGRADQAELALKVLLRIDPKHKKRRQLEKKIKAMAR